MTGRVPDERSADHASQSSRHPTTTEQRLVNGAAAVTVVGFFAVVGGLAAGGSVALYAWPVVGLAVVLALVAGEWFAGRPLGFSIGIRGVSTVGTILVAIFGLATGALFTWALVMALWWYIRP